MSASKTTIDAIHVCHSPDTNHWPSGVHSYFYRRRKVVGAFSVREEKQVLMHKGSLASWVRLRRLLKAAGRLKEDGGWLFWRPSEPYVPVFDS